jgi:hypothetical protein
MNPDPADTLLETRFKPNPSLADQTLGGKAVVLDYDNRRILGLNETGSRVWSMLDGTRTLREVCREVARENDVAVEQVVDDVRPFVEQLLERQLLVAD